PAIHISRMHPMEVLRDSSRSTTAGGRRLKIRGVFVIAQVALALVLLIGAGLMTHTLLRLNMIHPGFVPQELVTVQIPFPRTLYRSLGLSPTGGLQVDMSSRLNTQVEDVRNRIANLPGIDSVAVAMTPPLGGMARRFTFTREGMVLSPSEQEAWTAEW